MSLLTLDETTLFYWDLSSSTKKDRSGALAVADWSAEVKKKYGAPGSSNSKSNGTPSLTSSRSKTAGISQPSTRRPPSVASQTSALSNGIKITGLDDELIDRGAFSDRDETVGQEYEDKKVSPAKGKVRLSSQVCLTRPYEFDCY